MHSTVVTKSSQREGRNWLRQDREQWGWFQSRFTKTKSAGFGSEPPPTEAVPAGRTRRCTTDERCGVSIFPGSCNHCACVCVLFPCRYQCHTIYPADRDEAQQMFPEREGSLVKMKLLQLKCPKGNISFLEAHLVDFPVCSASSPFPHPSTLPRSSSNPGFEKKRLRHWIWLRQLPLPTMVIPLPHGRRAQWLQPASFQGSVTHLEQAALGDPSGPELPAYNL